MKKVAGGLTSSCTRVLWILRQYAFSNLANKRWPLQTIPRVVFGETFFYMFVVGPLSRSTWRLAGILAPPRYAQHTNQLRSKPIPDSAKKSHKYSNTPLRGDQLGTVSSRCQLDAYVAFHFFFLPALYCLQHFFSEASLRKKKESFYCSCP
ncbi:hypothetical protein EI94DRAFT_772361 [Lactarius quietus]|nr:hypothetical protein EI94DRAFT_772361 [Lactarius quietus]